MRGKSKDRRKQKHQKIHEKLHQYIAALEFFDDGTEDYIYMYDMTSERVFLADKIREKYPIPPAGEDGNDFRDWNEIVYPKDREIMNHYRKLLVDREIDSFNIAYRLLDRAGNKVWVRVKGALRNTEDLSSLLVVGRISEMVTGGMIDSLTGLCGTEKLLEDMKQHLQTSDGYLMLLDLDNFKKLNIARGRDFCDAVLKKVADILDECAADPMELYRLEGDRFAVNFIEKQQADVVQFYDAVKKALEGTCTVSSGVVSYQHREPTDSGMVYLYAENALDQAKREGRDQMVFFSAADYQRNLEQAELVSEIRACVQSGYQGFSVEYQPQISGQDFSIYGVEALLRYDSPTRGRISPEEFIPLLEQSGLICPVGQWVLKKAIAQCKKWREHIPQLHMSINVSYVQLRKNCITDVLIETLDEVQLPGEALTLELTENIQLQNYRHFNKIFYSWKQRGICISIDDFGTGYSSLGYLKSIEIDEVKIDKCFVEHVQYNTYNFHLLRNMIDLAHSAKIRVCCEGVETLEELIALQGLHADTLQGYFFAKPCTVPMFERTYICADSEAYRDREGKEAHIRAMEDEESKELLEELCSEEISNITESMDEIIYVSDTETYELYYLNEAGRRATGVYDYKGCKCYKVLQGKDKPCDFCTNGQLSRETFLHWERDNPFLNKHFMLKDKLIPWKRKLARVEIAVDITEKEVLSQSIQTRLQFERAIVESCRVLVSQTDTEKAVHQVLKIMVEFCKCDRAYILKQHSGPAMWDLAWEWCAEGRTSLQESFDGAIEEMSEEEGTERILHPIVRDNRTLGIMGVDNPENSEIGNELVKTMAYFLGYTMVGEETRRRGSAEAKRSDEEHTCIG